MSVWQEKQPENTHNQHFFVTDKTVKCWRDKNTLIDIHKYLYIYLRAYVYKTYEISRKTSKICLEQRWSLRQVGVWA